MATMFGPGQLVEFKASPTRTLIGRVLNVLPLNQYNVVVANRPLAVGPVDVKDMRKYTPSVNDFARYQSKPVLIVKVEGHVLSITNSEIGLIQVDLDQLQFGYAVAALLLNSWNTDDVLAIGELISHHLIQPLPHVKDSSKKTVQAWKTVGPLGAICSFASPGVAVIVYMHCQYLNGICEPNICNVNLVSSLIQKGNNKMTYQHEDGCEHIFTVIADGLRTGITNPVLWSKTNTVCPTCGADAIVNANSKMCSCGIPKCAFYSVI